MTKHDPIRSARILEYIRANPKASIREIAAEVGLASTAAVSHHLRNLERAGLLTDDACPKCGHRIRVAA